MSKMILIGEAKLTSVLEALEWNMDYLPSHGHGTSMASKAISALRETLAEQTAPMIRGDIRDGLVDDEPAQQQEPVQQGILARKWILHGSFADVASFDSDGVPSFYGKESVAKFQKGQLSEPCKGKNCGSLNGWLHSAECRAEHEEHYTSPQAQPARNPLTREQVKDLLFEAGYVGAEESADFINGLRHGEVAHGIKGDA